jgi:site-specific DNA-methyltransferase (adenine-specific)
MQMINLINADCLIAMSDIPDQSIDAIICDPPYGTTRLKWDSVIPLDQMWLQLKRVIKPDGAIVLFGSQPFTTTLIASNLEMFKYSLVWENSRGSNFVHAKYQPLKTHEDISVFSFGGAAQGSKTPIKYNPQKTEGKPYKRNMKEKQYTPILSNLVGEYVIENKTGDRSPRSVVKFASVSEVGMHPTQKPVDLMEYLVKTYTNEGDTVLDFTMGSGSTGVACVNTNRNFIGIELNKEYFEMASNRINSIKTLF